VAIVGLFVGGCPPIPIAQNSFVRLCPHTVHLANFRFMPLSHPLSPSPSVAPPSHPLSPSPSVAPLSHPLSPLSVALLSSMLSPHSMTPLSPLLSTPHSLASFSLGKFASPPLCRYPVRSVILAAASCPQAFSPIRTIPLSLYPFIPLSLYLFISYPLTSESLYLIIPLPQNRLPAIPMVISERLLWPTHLSTLVTCPYPIRSEWHNCLPNIRLPNTSLPNMRLSDMRLPGIRLPGIRLPDMSLPDMSPGTRLDMPE